jgi:hypothetical protein
MLTTMLDFVSSQSKPHKIQIRTALIFTLSRSTYQGNHKVHIAYKFIVCMLPQFHFVLLREKCSCDMEHIHCFLASELSNADASQSHVYRR